MNNRPLLFCFARNLFGTGKTSKKCPRYQMLLDRSYCSQRKCWNCSEDVTTHEFFCAACGKLLEAGTDDYFKLLSMDGKYNLDLNVLAKRYRDLQVLVHPDKYSNRSETEQKNSMEWSSLLNEAFKILSKPLERGEYILRQKGISLPQENSGLEKKFLLEIMEKNEEIEQADESNIYEYLSSTRETLQTLSESFDEMLSKEKYDEAKSLLVKMKYYKSLENTITEKILEIEKK